MKPYQRLLSEAVEGRTVVDVAKDWGVPRWVIDDGLRGQVNAPSVKYLPAVAAGLDMTVEELMGRLYAHLTPQEAPAT